MKSERKKLIAKLVKVFSEYIRERDGYKCFTCPKKGSPKDGIMQCGHLFSCTNMSTRFHPLNAHCQCKGCNNRHEYDWEVYRRAFVEKYGEEKYDELYAEHKKVVKYSTADLETMLDMFQKLTEELRRRTA